MHVIAHELLHLLGVGHEHQRSDRDKFVRINWSNIRKANAFNFFKDTWEKESNSSAENSKLVQQCQGRSTRHRLLRLQVGLHKKGL